MVGCATETPPTVIEYVPVAIPEHLMVDCPVPAWEGGTYRDLAALALRRETALLDCNARWGSLRRYQQRVLNPSD